MAAAAGWLLWGNNSIEVTRITIPHRAVPHAFDGFRIAHITDFHNTTFGKDHHRLLNALRKANPHIIAITGDMIDARRTDIPQALSFAEEIVRIAPCYYVMGNHEARIPDFPVFEKGLRECGVHVLRNESVCLERDGEYVTVIGLDDPAASEHFTGINLLNPWNNPCETDVIMKVVFRKGKINLRRSLINHPKSYNCKCLTWGLELRHFLATHDNSGTSPCAWHSWGGLPRHTELPACHSSHSTLVSFSTAHHMLW